MKTIIITGCGGLIGSESVEFFLKNYNVVGIDNNMRQYFFGVPASVIGEIEKFTDYDNFTYYNTDIRKVGVIIKQAYTTQKLLPNVDAYYRVYVREGQTEVQVQDWTKLNRTPNEYYFIFDTRDKIPNEYFVDMKVESSGEINTYKRTIKFQIVNLKYFEDL
jgi:hypothetical protein